MERKRWLLAELHCHSTNSDGELTPEEIVSLDEKKGYDVLAITDPAVLTQVRSKKMLIIPGYEWSVGEEKLFYSHLLIYFLKETPTSLNDAVSQEAFICIAHPATWPWWKKKMPPQAKGYEVFNYKLSRKFKIMGTIVNKMASLWYRKFYRIRVAGTDAHKRNEYAMVKCWIWAEPNLESIKQALLEGKIKIEY